MGPQYPEEVINRLDGTIFVTSNGCKPQKTAVQLDSAPRNTAFDGNCCILRSRIQLYSCYLWFATI